MSDSRDIARGPGDTADPGRRRGPVFLERATYRQRRLVDAIRMLPVLGACLWAVPMLWRKGGTTTANAMLYLFGLWVVLVLVSALVARALTRGEGGAPGGDGRAQPPRREAD